MGSSNSIYLGTDTTILYQRKKEFDKEYRAVLFAYYKSSAVSALLLFLPFVLVYFLPKLFIHTLLGNTPRKIRLGRILGFTMHLSTFLTFPLILGGTVNTGIAILDKILAVIYDIFWLVNVLQIVWVLYVAMGCLLALYTKLTQ
jgi:hypothetical protein